MLRCDIYMLLELLFLNLSTQILIELWIPFLDTLFVVQADGSYTTELYFKPMAAPIILHYDSAHPMATKKAVLTSQMRRAARVSSDTISCERSLAKMKTLFLENGYPAHRVHSAARAVHPHNRSRISGQRRHRACSNPNYVYMRLPFVDDQLCRQVNAAIRSSHLDHVRVAWTSGPTLKSYLVRSALELSPCPAGRRTCHTCSNGLKGRCTRKNVVYKITCNSCLGIFYVGETKRSIRDRYNEHLGDARLRREYTPLGEHMIGKHSNMEHSDTNTNFKVEILATARDNADLKVLESLHIRNLRPQLNTQTTSWYIT